MELLNNVIFLLGIVFIIFLIFIGIKIYFTKETPPEYIDNNLFNYLIENNKYDIAFEYLNNEYLHAVSMIYNDLINNDETYFFKLYKDELLSYFIPLYEKINKKIPDELLKITEEKLNSNYKI